jgi:hypothetical protein
LRALVRNSFVLDTEERATLVQQFDSLSDLVADDLCRHIDYPRRYADLPRVAASILADVSRARERTAAPDEPVGLDA